MHIGIHLSVGVKVPKSLIVVLFLPCQLHGQILLRHILIDGDKPQIHIGDHFREQYRKNSLSLKSARVTSFL